MKGLAFLTMECVFLMSFLTLSVWALVRLVSAMPAGVCSTGLILFRSRIHADRCHLEHSCSFTTSTLKFDDPSTKEFFVENFRFRDVADLSASSSLQTLQNIFPFSYTSHSLFIFQLCKNVLALPLLLDLVQSELLVVLVLVLGVRSTVDPVPAEPEVEGERAGSKLEVLDLDLLLSLVQASELESSSFFSVLDCFLKYFNILGSVE